MDPDLFLDMANFKEYVYSNEKCDTHVDRYEQLGHMYMAVMLDAQPIDEIVLKKLIKC